MGKMYMSKTTDKTEIILPLINEALETVGQQPAEVIQGDYGMPCLRLPAGERLRIRQLGELTMAMLPICIMAAPSPSKHQTLRSGCTIAIPRAIWLACPIDPTVRKSRS